VTRAARLESRRAGRRSLALAAGLALAPLAAHASEAEGGGSLVWHVVNLLLVIAVIVYFARTPVLRFFAERRQRIEDGIDSAQRELRAAEQRLAECQQRVARLDEELEEIRRAVRVQAENESARLLSDARATAERIRRDTLAAAEQEVRHARDVLRAETADLAVKLAADLLRAQVGDADRVRLADEFVQRVEQTPPAAGR
jgi:F-type H+-transporting ATPase subunit b